MATPFTMFIGCTPENFILLYSKWKKSNLTLNLATTCYNCGKKLYGPHPEQELLVKSYACPKCMEDLYLEALKLKE